MENDARPSPPSKRGPRALVEHDLDATEGSGGVVWHLPPDLQLNANLVRLAAGERIQTHRNAEVDVLIVVRAGSGELTVDDETHVLGAQTIAHVPVGTAREIVAGEAGLAYLTVHRQRGGLNVT